MGSKTPPICQVELLNVLFDQTLSNLSGIAESAKKTKKIIDAYPEIDYQNTIGT